MLPRRTFLSRALLTSGGAAAVWGSTGSASLAQTRERRSEAVRAVHVADVAEVGRGGDDHEALQKLVDANPKATIDFGSATFRLSAPLILTGPGRNFQGRLRADGAVLDFDFDGRPGDPDRRMASGIVARGQAVGPGQDTSGWRQGSIDGFTIYAPANGAGIYLANSQTILVENNTIHGGRYSVALEATINCVFRRNRFLDFSNAGLALLFCRDDQRVWYASASPEESFFNDSPNVEANAFVTERTGALCHILDHGSRSQGLRNIRANIFYNANRNCAVFGYLGRSGQLALEGNWTENIDYPVRTISTRGTERRLAAQAARATAAQPDIRTALEAIPDGYAYHASVRDNFFARSVITVDLSGVTGGSSLVAQNRATEVQEAFLASTESGKQMVLDLGNAASVAGTYAQFAYPTHRLLAQTAASADAAGTEPGVGHYRQAERAEPDAANLVDGEIAVLSMLELPPGDWDVSGLVTFTGGAGTTTAGSFAVGVTASATRFDPRAMQRWITAPTALGGEDQILAAPWHRRTLSAPTALFLVCSAGFAGHLRAYGVLSARLARVVT